MLRFLNRSSEKDWDRHLQSGIQAEREGRTDDARASFEAALKLAQEMPEDDPRRTRTLSLAADFFASAKLREDARRCFDELLRLTERSAGPNDPAVARVLSQMASADEAQGSLGRAEQLYRRAMRIFESSVGEDHRRTGMVAASIGNVLRLQEQWSDATPFYVKAIEIERKVGGGDIATLLRLYLQLSEIHAAMGREKQIEEVYLSAAELLGRAGAREQLGLISILDRLGNFYLRRNRLEEAREQYNKIFATQRQVLGKNHAVLAFTLARLAQIAEQQNLFSEADDNYTQAAEILEGGHSRMEAAKHAIVLGDLARVRYRRHRLDDAEKTWEQAIRRSREVLPASHPNLATPLTGLALLREELGKFREAGELAEEALTICDQAGDHRHPNTAQILDLMARLAERRQQWTEVQNYLARLVQVAEEDERSLPLAAASRFRRLAQAQLELGMHRQALASIERGVAILRYHPDYSKSAELREIEAFRARILRVPAP